MMQHQQHIQTLSEGASTYQSSLAGQLPTGSTQQHWTQQQKRWSSQKSYDVGSNKDGERMMSGQLQRLVPGQERVVSVTSRVNQARPEILSETVREKTVRVPKRIVHEDVIERVVIIPEVVQREEIIDEYQTVQEKVVEVAKPIITEKVIEVPEYRYIDKIVEVPEIIRQEKLRYVNKTEFRDRLVEVPNIVRQERVVEIPEIEYRDRIVEKIVEVPQIQEQYVTKHLPVTQYVDQPVPEYVDVEEYFDVARNLPVPVEVSTVFEYLLPTYTPRVTTVKYPVYIPRFIEVPLAEELFNNFLLTDLQQNVAHVGLLNIMIQQAVSLCELENLALNVRKADIDNVVASGNLKQALQDAWAKGTVRILPESERPKANRALRNRSGRSARRYASQ